MSNPPNIKLMNRSCFDRKRFAVLLHEDWAARRTRCLVTSPQATCYSLPFSRCLASKHIRKTPPCYRPSQRIYWKTSSPTSQTRPPTKMLRSSPLRHSFSYSLYSPVAMERAHIQQGKHIRYLLLPASTFEKFARWWLYTVPLSILAGVLIILAADITRVIICNMAFLDYSFARPSSLLPDFIRPPPALCSGCSSRPVCWAKPFPPEAKRDGHPCTAHSANAQSCCCPSF